MDKLIIADAVRATEAGAIAAARLMGRDEMAIEVADRHHMAMVFTGRRHFKH